MGSMTFRAFHAFVWNSLWIFFCNPLLFWHFSDANSALNSATVVDHLPYCISAVPKQHLNKLQGSCPAFCGAAFHQNPAMSVYICQIFSVVDQETGDRVLTGLTCCTLPRCGTLLEILCAIFIDKHVDSCAMPDKQCGHFELHQSASFGKHASNPMVYYSTYSNRYCDMSRYPCPATKDN